MRNKRNLHLIYITSCFSLLSKVFAASCPPPWTCDDIEMKVPYHNVLTRIFGLRPRISEVKIRSGFYPHQGTFKGNILYLPGLGDSILNHKRLFEALSLQGYRVVSFDYPGQGGGSEATGSTGKMSHTRIESIPIIAEEVWKKFANDTENFPEKTVIGWSTGGLAAYLHGDEIGATKLVLLAPPIGVQDLIVGEGLKTLPIDRMTIESLTSDPNCVNGKDSPYVEEAKPSSPFLAFSFGIHLLKRGHNAAEAAPPKAPTLVLLGEKDNYVNSKKVQDIVTENAQKAKNAAEQPDKMAIAQKNSTVIKIIPGAKHALDNEREELGIIPMIVNFVKNNNTH